MWSGLPPLIESGAALVRANGGAVLVYQTVATAFSAYTLATASGDWFTFRRPAPAETGGSPSLSVLIPARNEEANIEACLRSLLAQEYPGRLEILVLDDRSDDGTARVVTETADGDPRVRLLHGGDLARGWKGKPNALRQLAEAATGDVLLLTDADCVFAAPDALAAAVWHRERVGADCLSLMPRFVCGSFWEHVLIPLQTFIVFATLPVRKVYASKNPAFAAANGAFLLLPAETYRALGGHEAVRAEMAEDLKFGQYVKRRGYRLVYGDGSATYAVRMYDSLAGIWAGFSKNLFSTLGNSAGVLVFLTVFLLMTQVLPFPFLAAALARGDRSLAGFALPLAQVVVALGIRLALALRFRQAVWAVLTHPVGWLMTLAIFWNSAYLKWSGRGHAWKGRVYQP
jgi:chlorobactene glucosyltransferase